MPRPVALLLLVAVPVALVAAPVPKPTAAELIARAFGTVADKRSCQLAMDGKKVLTATLDGYDPPAEGTFKSPNGVSFRREVSGDFTATVRYAIKTDLTKVVSEKEYPRLNIGWHVSDATASCWLNRDHQSRIPLGFGIKPIPKVTSSFSSSVSIRNGDKHTVSGRSRSGGGDDYPSAATEFRLTRAKDVLTLSYRDDDGEWRTGEKETVAMRKDVTVSLDLSSSFGEPVDVVLDQFVLK